MQSWKRTDTQVSALLVFGAAAWLRQYSDGRKRAFGRVYDGETLRVKCMSQAAGKEH